MQARCRGSNPRIDKSIKDAKRRIRRTMSTIRHKDSRGAHRQVASVEVAISWGTSMLYFDHQAPPRSFDIGEQRKKGRACDCFLPENILLAPSAPLLKVDRDKRVYFILLPHATGTLLLSG